MMTPTMAATEAPAPRTSKTLRTSIPYGPARPAVPRRPESVVARSTVPRDPSGVASICPDPVWTVGPR